VAWVALGLAAGYAVLDELRQGLAPGRSPSALDVVINAAGAAVGVASQAGPGPLGRGVLRGAQAAALALATGSLVAAGLDWRLGLGPGDLLAAAAGLLALAGALQLLARRWVTARGPEYDRRTRS
jgi:hypothetical protein